DGTDDAECDLSDRPKESDEVGPETGARGFAYFGPIKVTRRGAKRGLEQNPTHLTSQNCHVTQSVQNG
ncbi:Uncharacterized protein ALO63_03625, partial [Pseudomonas amygdali pv. mori]